MRWTMNFSALEQWFRMKSQTIIMKIREEYMYTDLPETKGVPVSEGHP